MENQCYGYFHTQKVQEDICLSIAGSNTTLHSIELSKFIVHQIKFALANDNPGWPEQCKMNKTDRQYQIWKRKPLSIELSSENVFKQKLEYIHYNPVKAGICLYPEEYHCSSALFYEKQIDSFNMLTHYLG